MLKRNCFVIILGLFIIGIPLTAFATTNHLKALLDTAQLSAAEEQQEVLQAIERNKVREELVYHKQEYQNKVLDRVYTPYALSYGTPYKVVVVDRNLADALLAKKNLAPFIAKAPYFWEVPVLVHASKQVVTSFMVDKIKGKWEVAEIGSFLPNEAIVFSNDANQITTALQNNGLEDVTHLAHLRFSGAFTKDYLYVSDTQHEYFIPVNPAQTSAKDGINPSLTTEASVSERTKLTTDEILSQFGDELKPTNKKKVPKGQILLGGSGGGAPTTPASSLPLGLYLIFGCGAVMLIGLGWMIYRKKRPLNSPLFLSQA